jgi:ubiquinone/menaquinone biosynthesis C-methylase UbiE
MYHEYYDIIYRDYDYALDTETLEYYRQAFHLNNSSLLEIGCGTGRHTALLSKYFTSIYAIDIDPCMIERAKLRIEQEKITNVSFSNCSALDLDPTPSDMACAFFNVINYILDFNDLILFFDRIARSLLPQGIFVFDSLDATNNYGEKASSTITYDFDNQKCFRSVSTVYDREKQTLHNKEEYRGLSGTLPSLYEATYKLWTQVQIEQAAEQVGLMPLLYSKKIDLNPHYQKKNQVLFVVQKEKA